MRDGKALSGKDYFRAYRHGEYYMDVLSVLVFVTLAANLLLLFFHCKNFYRFWQHRQSIAIARRHPEYVLLFNALLLLFSHVYSPFQALVVCVQWFRAPFWTIYAGFGFTCFGVSWIFLMRAWLLYFAHGYHSSIAGVEWSSRRSSQWFVRNSHTWGRPKWLFWPIFAGWLLCTAALTAAALWVQTVYPKYHTVTFVFTVAGAGIAFAVDFGLWFNLRLKPFVNADVFHIQDELRVAALLTFTMCGIYGVNHLCWLFVYNHFGSRVFRDRVDSLVFCVLCFVWANVLMYHSTAQTLSSNRHFLEIDINDDLSTKRQTVVFTAVSRRTKTFVLSLDTGVELPDESEEVSLYEILVYDDCFQLFSDHLRREFSGEILSGFVEFTQFAIHCLEAGFWEADLLEDNSHITTRGTKMQAMSKPCFLPNFSKLAPISSIIAERSFATSNSGNGNEEDDEKSKEKVNEESDDDIGKDSQSQTRFEFESTKRMALALFKKYIARRAPLELNLPSRMRSALIKQMPDEDSWMNESVTSRQMVLLFEAVRLQTQKQLHFSLNIMQSTDWGSRMLAAARSERRKAYTLSHSVAPNDYSDLFPCVSPVIAKSSDATRMELIQI